jgi:acyl-CoA thioesterase-1
VAITFALVSCALPGAPGGDGRPGGDAIRYVAIGASDTVGIGAEEPAKGAWPALLAAKLPPGTSYTNVGVSGSLTGQARIEQLPLALRARPTLVTIWLAVNDLNAGIHPAAYQSELETIIDRLVAETDARVFVGTIPDLRPVPVYQGADPNLLISAVHAYNGAITQAAARHQTRVHVVDLFSGSAELVSKLTVSPDGLHPTDAGYQLIADRFAETMRARGVPLR